MLDLNQIQNQNQRGIVLSRGNLALSLFLHLHQNHVKKKQISCSLFIPFYLVSVCRLTHILN